MDKLKSRRGISPLIAAVLLIAFTMAISSIFAQWAPNLIQNVQQDTSQQRVDISRASNLGLEIMSVSFDRNDDQLEVIVQNTGEAINNKTNISIGVTGDSVAKTQQYDVDLSSKEVTTLKLPINRTYPLETIQIDLTRYPVSTESEIKCTPTNGLVGYWSFNEEKTENRWVKDISGLKNNGSLEGNIDTNTRGRIGGSYAFDGGSYISNKQSVLEEISNTSFTIQTWIYRDSTTDDTFVGFIDNDYDGFILIRNSNRYPNVRFENINGTRLDLNPSDLPEGEWENVVVAYSENTGEAKVFYNSELVASKSFAEEESNKIDVKGEKADIGRDGRGNEYFNGMIDEPRIYNRSLSQEEIQRLYKVRSEDWAINACKVIA